MHLYRTRDGMARREGDDLALLELPLHDATVNLSECIEWARHARVRNRIPLDAAEVLCPTAPPGKMVLAGANYVGHVAEAGMPTPTAPVFLSTAGDAVIGPGAAIVLPAEAPDHVDYEGELALVVGIGGRDIAAADAWKHIAAVTIANDISARDVQLAGMVDGVIADPDGVRRAKVFPTFKPLGPCLVTVDEFASPLDLAITTHVNGHLRQAARTSEMIFSVPQIIEHVSASMHLAPGDVILTGTPAGVGLASGDYLRSGDLVVVEIEGIGRLVNPVVAAATASTCGPTRGGNQ